MDLDAGAVQADALHADADQAVLLKRLKEAVENTGRRPPPQPHVDRVPVAETLRQRPPLAAVLRHIEDGVDDLEIADPHVAPLHRQQRTDHLMRQFLAREGLDVVTARDGAEGLDLARRQRPALITLDVLMPGPDGWDVLRQLKADSELASIPVLMLTILDEKKRAFALGAAEYMTKPFDRERLRALLARLSGRRVLIVEDDDDARRWLARILAGEGWQVREAEHGRQALDCLAEKPVDLILLDLMMPEMDGFQFLAEFRTHPAWRRIPVVVVTAADLTEDDRRRLSGGVLHVLQKSGQTLEQLMAELRQLVSRDVTRGPNSARGMVDG
jgi:adenylate cyclase